ncbi:MAG: MaoC family dehydratase N-terminal domain-containing protein [Anaerolineae bacterium]|nr:MaoC family dehydratase N-terminal domain-containing protein [Anaerolineae bacterium]
MPPLVRGMYFEEFEPGLEILTSARTITETDIVNFAGLTGDFNFIHTDAVAAQESPFGQRVAHGMLIASIATGLSVQQGFIDGTTLAFRELTWKFTKPVHIGDTVHVRIKVTATKAMKKLGGGVVDFDARVYNQKDELVHKGEWRMLIKSRPEEA